jgi:hypothetical protein
MLNVDSTYVLGVVWRLFLLNLGETEASCLATYERLREFLPGAMATPEGAILSHIFVGVDMASKAGAELTFLVDKGVYQGFVLSGNGFFVVNKGVKVETVPYVTLQGHLNSMGSHDQSLQWICNLLSQKPLDREFWRGDVEEVVEVKPESIKSRFTLQAEVIKRGNALTLEEKGEVMRNVQDLTSFEAQDYLAFSADGVMKFLDAWAGSRMLTEYNMDISGEKLFEKDFLSRLLLLFGPVCPSLNFPGQKHLKIPRKKEEDKMSVGQEVIVIRDGKEERVTKRALEALVFRRVAHKDAVVDWRGLFQTGSFGQPSEKISRKKASSYYILTEGKMVDFWRGLYRFGKEPEKRVDAPEVPVNPLIDSKGAAVKVSDSIF